MNISPLALAIRKQLTNDFNAARRHEKLIRDREAFYRGLSPKQEISELLQETTLFGGKTGGGLT